MWGHGYAKLQQRGSPSQQIARAIEWIKDNFSKPLRIDDLAEQARMSTSTFRAPDLTLGRFAAAP